MNETNAAPRMSWPALLAGLGMMLAITAYPGWLSDAQGRADHSAAMLAGAVTAAGFVRGVGFIPQHAIPRTLLSGWACLAYLSLLVLRLYWLHR